MDAAPPAVLVCHACLCHPPSKVAGSQRSTSEMTAAVNQPVKIQRFGQISLVPRIISPPYDKRPPYVRFYREASRGANAAPIKQRTLRPSDAHNSPACISSSLPLCRRFHLAPGAKPLPPALILSPSPPLLSFQFMPQSRIHARQRADKEENVPARVRT